MTTNTTLISYLITGANVYRSMRHANWNVRITVTTHVVLISLMGNGLVACVCLADQWGYYDISFVDITNIQIIFIDRLIHLDL